MVFPAGEVFSRERQQLIAEFVTEHGRARVSDLARRFGVSTVTIRKDLVALEATGRLVRAHGGAIAAEGARREGARAEGSFEVRERRQPAAKDRIGALAASFVVDGESIAFDASTTALAVARHIKARGPWMNLTVTTNGLRIASELAGTPASLSPCLEDLFAGRRSHWLANWVTLSFEKSTCRRHSLGRPASASSPV